MTKKAVMIMMIVFLLIGAGSGFIVGEVLNKDTQENAQKTEEIGGSLPDEKSDRELDQNITKQVELYCLKKTGGELTTCWYKSVKLPCDNTEEIIRKTMEELIKGPYTQNAAGTKDQNLIPIIPEKTTVKDVKKERSVERERTIVTYTVTLSEEAIKNADEIVTKVNQTTGTGNKEGAQKQKPVPVNQIGDKVLECLQKTLNPILEDCEEITIKIYNYSSYSEINSKNNYWESIIKQYIQKTPPNNAAQPGI